MFEEVENVQEIEKNQEKEYCRTLWSGTIYLLDGFIGGLSKMCMNCGSRTHTKSKFVFFAFSE